MGKRDSKDKRKGRHFETPKIGPRHVVYQDKYQKVYQVKANFGEFTKEYFVTDTGRRAGIVVTRGSFVLLVRQYHLLVNSLSWEIPGGRVDNGAAPEEAELRECFEETGVRCLNPRPCFASTEIGVFPRLS